MPATEQPEQSKARMLQRPSTPNQCLLKYTQHYGAFIEDRRKLYDNNKRKTFLFLLLTGHSLSRNEHHQNGMAGLRGSWPK